MKTLLKSSVFPLAILAHVLIRVYFTSDFLNDPDGPSAIQIETATVPQVNLVEEVQENESLVAIIGKDI